MKSDPHGPRPTKKAPHKNTLDLEEEEERRQEAIALNGGVEPPKTEEEIALEEAAKIPPTKGQKILRTLGGVAKKVPWKATLEWVGLTTAVILSIAYLTKPAPTPPPETRLEDLLKMANSIEGNKRKILTLEAKSPKTLESKPTDQIILDSFPDDTKPNQWFLLLSNPEGVGTIVVSTQNKQLIELILGGQLSPGTKVNSVTEETDEPDTVAIAKRKKASPRKLKQLTLKK